MTWLLRFVLALIVGSSEVVSSTDTLADDTVIVAKSLAIDRLDPDIRATSNSQDLESQLARTNYLLAVSRWRENRLADSYTLLYDIPEKHRNVEWHLLKYLLEGSDRTYYGHSGMAYSIACSPDGKLIASGDVDSNIKIWDAEDRVELRTLHGHRNWVSCVAFSPDGSLLASAADDSTIKFWNPIDGRLIRTIETEYGAPCIVFSPDGSQLVSAVSDRLESWDVKTGSKIRDLFPRGKDRSGATVDSLAFSPDGSNIASPIGRDIHVWNTQNGEVICVLKGSEFDVERIAILKDSKSLVSISRDGTFRMWDLTSANVIRSFPTTKAARSLAISPDESVAAIGDYYGAIGLFEVKTGRLIRQLRGHFDLVNSLAFSPDGSKLFSGSRDRLVKEWQVASYENPMSWLGVEDDPEELLSPDGSLRATTSEDHSAIQVSDAKTGQLVQSIPKSESSFSSFAFFPDGATLVTGATDGKLTVWNARTGEAVASFQTTRGDPSRLAVSPDGSQLAVLAEVPMNYSTLEVWDANTGMKRYAITIRQGDIYAIAFNADGSRIAGVDISYDGRQLILWDAATGEELINARADEARELTSEFRSKHWSFAQKSSAQNDVARAQKGSSEIVPLCGHTDVISDASFSPDGTRVVTTSADGTIKIWDPKTGLQVNTIRDGIQGHTKIRFNPSGKTFLSWGYKSHSISLWDISTGQPVRSIEDPHGEIDCAEFSHDGRLIASVSGDNKISIWDTDSGRSIHTLKGSERGLLTALAFDAAGNRLVSAAYDGIKVWDVKQGKEISTLRGPQVGAWKIYFSADQTRIIAHTYEGKCVAWDANSGDLITEDEEYQQDPLLELSPDGQWMAIPVDKIVLLVRRTK